MGVVLPGLLRDERALLSLLNLRVFQVIDHAARCRLIGRRRRVVVVARQQTAVVVEILVCAIDVIEQVGVGVIVAADGRRRGIEDELALAVVGVELIRVEAAGRVVMIVEHDLGVGVGVHGVRAAVGVGHHRLHGPAVIAGGIAAGGVAEGVSAQAAAGLRIAGARRHFLGDALLAVILEVVIGIGGHLGIAQAAEIGAQGGGQTGVGGGIKDVFQSASVAVGLTGRVVAVIAGLQHIAGAIKGGGGHEIADVAAVLLGTVIVGVGDLLHRGPGAAVDLTLERHIAQESGVDIRGRQIAEQPGLGDRLAVAGSGALHLGDVAVAGVRRDIRGHAVGIGVALELSALGGLPGGGEAIEDDLIAHAVDERVGVVAAVVGQLGGIAKSCLVAAVDQGEVVGGGAVGDDDERIVRGAIGLDQLRRVGIDPAIAVDAVRVAGAVGPGAGLGPGKTKTG